VVDGDSGVPRDTVAEVSRLVSEALDSSDAMGGQPYVLEVSSPGVDRPLTAPRHWRRAVGHLVRSDLVGGGEMVGRVTGADDEAADLLVDDQPRRLHYSDVVRAAVQVEFSRPGQPEDADDLDDDPDDTSSSDKIAKG
jgi:ribosome maturation factor RimP